MMAIIASFIYGILALGGGLTGYAKAKSKPSLISGVISGLLLFLAGGMQIIQVTGGLTLAQIVTAMLVVVFGIRLVKTRKFMPSGLMLSAGIATLIVISCN